MCWTEETLYKHFLTENVKEEEEEEEKVEVVEVVVFRPIGAARKRK